MGENRRQETKSHLAIGLLQESTSLNKHSSGCIVLSHVKGVWSNEKLRAGKGRERCEGDEATRPDSNRGHTDAALVKIVVNYFTLDRLFANRGNGWDSAAQILCMG